MRKGTWITIWILLVAVLLVAGCTTAPPSPGGQQTPDTSGTPTVPPSSGRLVFLTEEYPPFNYHENGVLTGISVDLLNETLQRLGSTQSINEVQTLPWESAYNRTLSEPNTVLFATSRLSSREPEFKWAGPIAPERSVLFALRGGNVTVSGPADLARFRIGVVRNDAARQKLADLGVPADRIRIAERQEELPAWVDAGEVDLFAYGEAAGRMLAAQGNRSPLRFVPVYTLAEYETWFAFNRQTPDETVARFQAALDRLSVERNADNLTVREEILARYSPAEALSRMTFFTEEYPPFNTLVNGTIGGIAPELLRTASSALNATLRPDQVRLGTWSEGYNTALTTNYSVVFSTARTPEREGLFRWAGPIGRFQYVILADRDRGLPANVDPAALRIVTIQDDVSGTLLREQGIPKTAIRYEVDTVAMVEAVRNGSVDALAYPLLPARSLLERYGLDPNRFGVVRTLGEQEMYFAFNRNTSPVVVDAFNRTLTALKTEKDERGVAPYERILYRNIGPECSSARSNTTGAVAVVDLTVERLAADTPATLSEINRGVAPFRDPSDPEVYAFVYDTNLTMVAHAANPRLVGENYRGKTDAAGTPFRDRFLATATSKGSGWVDYVYVNLAESRLSWKTTYCRSVRGSDGREYIVCAGTFKDCRA
ncbi:MAG TPA: transporter substrate-binding domain-containing protein [Methanoregulaceae archaeon]|nr:transporter substrate-binding domain-containing protein [Methanoregulaceae archaeon]HQJ87406.1 transporter substrate-binding domain-containing protein [Methanoregulaceae archaeon]